AHPAARADSWPSRRFVSELAGHNQADATAVGSVFEMWITVGCLVMLVRTGSENRSSFVEMQASIRRSNQSSSRYERKATCKRRVGKSVTLRYGLEASCKPNAKGGSSCSV